MNGYLILAITLTVCQYIMLLATLSAEAYSYFPTKKKDREIQTKEDFLYWIIPLAIYIRVIRYLIKIPNRIINYYNNLD